MDREPMDTSDNSGELSGSFNDEAQQREEEGRRRTQFFTSLSGHRNTHTKQILAGIANGLSVDDLRNFRLASKFLYQASLKTWRRKMLLRISFTPSHFVEPIENADATMIALNKALNLTTEKRAMEVFQLADEPYRSLKILNWDWQRPDIVGRRDEDVIDLFMKKEFSVNHLVVEKSDSIGFKGMLRVLDSANELKSLILKDCGMPPFSDLKEYRQFNQEIDDTGKFSLPVTHLTVDAFSEPEQQDHQKYRSWKLLKHFPLLKQVYVHLRQPMSGYEVDFEHGFRENLRNYRQQIGNDLLQVKISGLVEFQGNIDQLMEAPLPLEEWNTRNNKPNFMRELNRRSRKLRILWLTSGRTVFHFNSMNSDSRLHDYIHLPVLQELYFTGKHTTSLDFLVVMPALQKLVADLHPSLASNDDSSDDESGTVEMNKDLVEMSAVLNQHDVVMEHLTHLDINAHLKLESLPGLKKLMPNLSVLKMVFLSNQMFSFACENWPTLVHLRVLGGSRVDDNGITGVDFVSGQQAVKPPNLTSLKSLESFEISSERVLTELSVLMAFRFMEKLTQLRIHHCPPFNQLCTELLKSKFTQWWA